MNDRERLAKIDKRYHYQASFIMGHRDKEWLIETLKKYMDSFDNIVGEDMRKIHVGGGGYQPRDSGIDISDPPTSGSGLK